jgi:hypothetical protein
VSGRRSGAARIFLYNWPTYAGTWTGGAFVLVAGVRLGGAPGWLLGIAAMGAVLWSVLSLVVSHYIYDRSALASGSWVSAFLPTPLSTWASIDAGLDAEVALDGVLAGTCMGHLDIYDGVMVYAPSVKRARRTTPRAYTATPCRATALALADASCDLIAVVFTAHEVRSQDDRAGFFVEVRRALRPGGRLLLVEHLRDTANFVAFGPGFLHFQSRAEWQRLAEVAGLRVAREARVTPWVMALGLEKPS